MGVILAPIVEGKLDVWFREKIKEVHGLDVTQPPPGPACPSFTSTAGPEHLVPAPWTPSRQWPGSPSGLPYDL